MKTPSPTARARAEFFGLRHLPFQPSRSAADLFLSASRQETLAFLNTHSRGPGVALLSGGAGVGKTAIIRSFITSRDGRNPSIIIALPQDGRLNLVREAGKRFCIGIDDGASADQIMRQLAAELRKMETSSIPLLIVDQAERLTADSAPSLCALAQAAFSGSLPLSIALASSPVHRHSDKARDFSLESFVSSRHALAAFEPDESATYVREQISSAGGDADTLFEPAAIEEIQQHARGIPAEINALCGLALRLAHRAGEHTVRLGHVEAIARRRARIQKSASRAEVMIRHPRTPRDARPAARDDGRWHLVSLADIDSSGCSDAVTHNVLHAVASIPLHESADSTAHRAVAHRLPARDEFSTQRLGEIGQGLEDLHERAEVLDAKSERVAALLDALDERILRAETATARATESELRLRTIATHVADHTEALQERMSALLGMADSSQDVEENLRRLGASAEAVAAAAYQRLSDAGTAWQKNLSQSGEQAARLLAEKSAALQAQTEQATLLIEERGPKFVRLAEHQIQDAIRELSGKLTPIRTEIQGLLAEANVVIANTRTQFEAERERAERSVEQMHAQTADRLIAVSTACQRAEATCESLQKATAQSESSLARTAEIEDELNRSRSDAKTIAAELARNASAARRAGDTLSSLCLAADEKDQQLASHQAAARSLVTHLTDTTIAAADAAKVLEEKRAAARADIEEHRSHLEAMGHTAEERTATISSALEQSASAAAAERSRLENQVAASVTASANLQKVVAVAMDARTQMQASAEEALRQSSRLQETCDEARAATAAATETRTALTALEAQTSSTIGRLQADAQAAAAKLSAELQTALTSASQEIRANLQDAGAASQSLDAAVRKAHQSAATLEGMAQASSQAAQSALEKSRTSMADLDRAAEAAKTQAAELQAARNALIESHRGLVLDAETLLNRVAMRLEAVNEMDGKLAEYDAATESLGNHITRLEEQLAAAATAVSRPQRILADAQAYAGQLERVCDAAKKVKTSVSQAALAADERARELTSAEQEASHRLHHLRQDLSAAAHTLAQWVQEADRAQTRLESTIQSCPPIGQTHATQSLKSLAKTAAQAAQVRERAPARHPQVISSLDRADRTAVQPTIGAAQPPTREEEIASLLAEARKARKEVDGSMRPRAHANKVEDNSLSHSLTAFPSK